MNYTTKEIVESFVNGWTDEGASASGGRLYVEGKNYCQVLINYSTVIALRDDFGNIWINDQVYSKTTTKHQNRLKKHAPSAEIVDEGYIMDIKAELWE